MTIKAFLFDKDGTLIDFEKTYGPSTTAVINHLSKGNNQLAEAMANCVDFHIDTNRFETSSIVIAGSGMDIAKAWGPLLKEDNLEALTRNIDALYADYSTQYAQAFSFTQKTLEELQAAGFILGIATNDSEQGALNHMGKLGLTRFFEMIIGADSGYGAKPNPGMIEAFADKMGLKSSEIAMVGDSSHDLITAQNAGSLGVGVTTGLANKVDLTPFSEQILESIEQLPQWVTKQSR